MKILVCLATLLVAASAESDPDPYYYGLGYSGYGGLRYGGHYGYGYNRLGYGHGYGVGYPYGGYYANSGGAVHAVGHTIGKRSADPEPTADPDAYYGYYGYPYSGYGTGYYGHGYYSGYGHGYYGHGYGHGYYRGKRSADP